MTVSRSLLASSLMTFLTAFAPFNVCSASAQNVRYLLTGNGGRVDWCQQNQLLAVDRIDARGFTRIWSMDKDGNSLKCLSCMTATLPQEHQGNPSWHPSGRFIVFQAVDPKIASRGMSKTMLYKIYTSPGAGVNNNIWIMTADGQRAWQITKLGKGGGVLHPHFSSDGSKILWAERVNNEQGIGRWVMKLGTFEESNGEPFVRNIETLAPGDLLFYETHGFSPDGSRIIFTGMPSHGLCADFDIYTYDPKTKSLTCLTDPKLRQWDEHAHYTPDGKRIVWMSSMGNPQAPKRLNQITVKTDFWIMNADGSNKKQISFFNDGTKGSNIDHMDIGGPFAREQVRKWNRQRQWKAANAPNRKQHGTGVKPRVIASDLTISGDGSCIYGYIQDPGTVTRPGSVVRLELPGE